MRVMFLIDETFDEYEWKAYLKKKGIPNVCRRIWTAEGNRIAFIVSQSDRAQKMRWVGVDQSKWWTITSCNKQYTTAYWPSDEFGSTHVYLGCLTSVSVDEYTAICQIDGYILITDHKDYNKAWAPRKEGSPSRLIHAHTSEPKSLKSEDTWPEDPAAPKVDHTDDLHKMQIAVSAIVVQLNVISRARRRIEDA